MSGADRTLVEKLEHIVRPSIEAMGYDLVRLMVAGGQRKLLQVMAEPLDGRLMSLADCQRISSTLSAILDVEDPIAGAYSLEVSSPGIDRPLTRAKDYARFAGHEAKLETHEPVEGRRRFKGIIKGLADDKVIVAGDDGGEVALPLALVAKAKLVLTDALIRAHETEKIN
jgi:ribosome maturation factor RimP